MPRTIECELTEDMVDQCVPGVWSPGVPAAHAVHAPYSIHVQCTASTSRTTYNAATGGPRRRSRMRAKYVCVRVRACAGGDCIRSQGTL